MQVRTFLHKLFDTAIHQSRVVSLIVIVNGIIITKELKLTRLGRGLEVAGKERSGIRRMDRMLGNKYYQKNNMAIYQCMTKLVIGRKTRPMILVDWSGIPNSHRKTKTGEYCVLKATLATEGRGITLYDEVHTKKKEGNAKVHARFLDNLRSILPVDCCPIIVTDAGYKNPWFKSVVELGWDYVGRIRGKVSYKEHDEFKAIRALFSKASATPKSLGKMMLAKSNPLSTNFYSYKHKLQGRKKHYKNKTPDNSRSSKKYSAGYRKPWILVSSLSGHHAAKKVVEIYKRRMRIEETFRDIKSLEYGFRMNENVTIKSERLIVWFMLAALASIYAWIIGYAAEKINLHYDFQVNTCKNKRTLSFFFLGCQVIRKKIKIPVNLDAIYTEAWSVEL